MIKHATASVFVFARQADGWRLGLVRHPRFGRWMLPGGHVEPDENPAEAALREVAEETGHTARLLPPPTLVAVDQLREPVVPAPVLIVEQHVPPDREPSDHVHLDHLYVALAGNQMHAAELPVGWYDAGELDELEMFADTRTLARQLLGQVTEQVADLAAGELDAAGRGHA